MRRKLWIIVIALALCALFLLAGRERPARLPDAWDGEVAALGLLLQDQPDGLQVLAVWDGSPAQLAGLAPGDRLTAVNGQPFLTLAEMESLLAACPPSETLVLSAQRQEEDLLAIISPP